MLSNPETAFERTMTATLRERLLEPRRFIQAVVGPRQVGKTTAVHQVLEGLTNPAIYASADQPTLRAVGAHLTNALATEKSELFYWRDRGDEVDFVAKTGRRLIAIEVKSTAAPKAHSGLASFSEVFNPDRTLLIGSDSLSVEEFLSKPVAHWVRAS